MWDLPGPGFEPVSPALAGGFLTTAPPGKPRDGPLEDGTLEVRGMKDMEETAGEGLEEEHSWQRE